MKRNLYLLMAAMLCGMSSAWAYDFSAVCATGQTLYYNITDAVNHEVELTYPGENGEYGWGNFPEPIGEIELPSTVVFDNISYSLTSVGDYAFFACRNLTGNLIIPNTVESIGAFSFWECRQFTGDLVIPNSVSSIGESAFRLCGFSGNLIIGSSVTSIGKSAFYMCFYLTGELIIPNSVISIGENAFYSCFGFSGELIIPNSVILIGECAFTGCGGFTSLVIGENVTTIEAGAFISCDGLSSITVNRNVPPTCGEMVFSGIDTTIPIYVPCGTKQAYQEAMGWNQFTNYRQMPYYVFTVESNDPEFGTVVVIQEPDCETEGIVEAIPAYGFDFLGWSTVDGDFISFENLYSFTLTEDLHLWAHFGWNDGVGDYERTDVMAYPNPTTGLLTIEGEGIARIEVSNTMGQCVAAYEANDSQTTIDINALPEGIYFVGITNESGRRLTQKVVKK